MHRLVWLAWQPVDGVGRRQHMQPSSARALCGEHEKAPAQLPTCDRQQQAAVHCLQTVHCTALRECEPAKTSRWRCIPPSHPTGPPETSTGLRAESAGAMGRGLCSLQAVTHARHDASANHQTCPDDAGM